MIRKCRKLCINSDDANYDYIIFLIISDIQAFSKIFLLIASLLSYSKINELIQNLIFL